MITVFVYYYNISYHCILWDFSLRAFGMRTQPSKRRPYTSLQCIIHATTLQCILYAPNKRDRLLPNSIDQL